MNSFPIDDHRALSHKDLRRILKANCSAARLQLERFLLVSNDLQDAYSQRNTQTQEFLAGHRPDAAQVPHAATCNHSIPRTRESDDIARLTEATSPEERIEFRLEQLHQRLAELLDNE